METMPLNRQRFLRLRRFRWPLAALGILLLAWLFFRGEDEQAVRYDYLPVTRGSIEEAVTAQGKLEPKEFVDVGTQVSGLLQKLHVEIGDNVKKGQLIAEIDPKLYVAKVEEDEARLKSLQSQLAEQQAQMAYTHSVYLRNQMLVKEQAVSKETYELSLKEFKAAESRANSYKAQIEEAQSTLEGDRTNLGYTKIYSPMDGTVVSQTSKEGQTLNANQTAPVVVQVANLDVMTVRAQVAEADVARLKPGMPVYFNTLGSERRWESTVRQILPSPDATVTDVVLYNALVDVTNSDRSLKTGMSTQMFFVLGRADNVLQVPVRSLGKKVSSATGEKGDIYEVRLAAGKKIETRQVEIGLMNRNVAEVKNGLGEHDRVAVVSTEKPDGERRPGPRI